MYLDRRIQIIDFLANSRFISLDEKNSQSFSEIGTIFWKYFFISIISRSQLGCFK
jgi:hypothetical protein